MLQMWVALGRDLGSFWSMSSICVQVKDGRMEGGKERKEDDEGRERRGKRGKESKGAGEEGGGGGEKRGREGTCMKWEARRRSKD